MVTVNSLSGGKTSSYLAAHYPADIEIFALVCIDCHNAGNGIDKKIKQMVNDRLQKYCSHQKEFVATAEDPKILKVIFDIEQHIGREITWVRGLSWEEMMNNKNILPNRTRRFCTTIMKMIPIFEYLFKYHELPVKMRLGYRYDEKERQERATTTMKYSLKANYYEKSNRWLHRWEEIIWRANEFPLIEDKVFHFQVQKYWEDKDIIFPDDSNCQFCFWKQVQQLRKNFDTNKQIMDFASVFEGMFNSRFHDNMYLRDIKKIALQGDFNFGTGSGCQAGFCTD